MFSDWIWWYILRVKTEGCNEAEMSYHSYLWQSLLQIFFPIPFTKGMISQIDSYQVKITKRAHNPSWIIWCGIRSVSSRLYLKYKQRYLRRNKWWIRLRLKIASFGESERQVREIMFRNNFFCDFVRLPIIRILIQTNICPSAHHSKTCPFRKWRNWISSILYWRICTQIVQHALSASISYQCWYLLHHDHLSMVPIIDHILSWVEKIRHSAHSTPSVECTHYYNLIYRDMITIAV